MFNKISRKEMRKSRHYHIRKVMTGTAERPRMSVFRSSKHIAVQVIDDIKGVTLVAASTYEKELSAELKNNKKALGGVEAAKHVGKVIAERAKGKNITEVAFDRSGNLYVGRIKALADEARNAGLKF